MTVGSHLPQRDYPFGHIAWKIRLHYARHISKNISKTANIDKGARIDEFAIVHDRGGVGIDCKLMGPVEIGENVMMGPDCRIFTANHNFDKEQKRFIGFTKPEPVIIGDGSWIGYGVIILPGVKIGKGCIVGAGSVVTKSCGDYVLIAGNPAVVKKSLLD